MWSIQVNRAGAALLWWMLSATALGCGGNPGVQGGADGGAVDSGPAGADGAVSASPILNASFETASTAGSAWISGAENWKAGGSVRRVADLQSLASDGQAVMRIGAGQSSTNDLCPASFSYIAQSNVDLSRVSQLLLDWKVVGTMTYSSQPSDIVFSVGLQHGGTLWEKRFSPPSSGYAYLDHRGTATMAIPAGVQPGELSVSVQYVGAVGVDVEECVIAYVDNLRVQ